MKISPSKVVDSDVPTVSNGKDQASAETGKAAEVAPTIATDDSAEKNEETSPKPSEDKVPEVSDEKEGIETLETVESKEPTDQKRSGEELDGQPAPKKASPEKADVKADEKAEDKPDSKVDCPSDEDTKAQAKEESAAEEPTDKVEVPASNPAESKVNEEPSNKDAATTAEPSQVMEDTPADN